ncbi:hypothetical protein TKK_0004632 [Trichogramma kaykai]
MQRKINSTECKPTSRSTCSDDKCKFSRQKVAPQEPVADCDWVYEESNCRRNCVLASPGYPGLYPPNSKCRYLITSNSTVTINLSFTTVLMPANSTSYFETI